MESMGLVGRAPSWFICGGVTRDSVHPDLVANGDLSTQGMIKKVKYSVSGREPEKRGFHLNINLLRPHQPERPDPVRRRTGIDRRSRSARQVHADRRGLMPHP